MLVTGTRQALKDVAGGWTPAASAPNSCTAPAFAPQQVQQGLAAGAAKEEVFLGPATPRTRYGPELHAAACVLKLIEA